LPGGLSMLREPFVAKRIGHLRCIAARNWVALNPNNSERLVRLMERPEQAVPDEPELPEVHLRFLEAFSVVPAVKFCTAQDALERA